MAKPKTKHQRTAVIGNDNIGTRMTPATIMAIARGDLVNAALAATPGGIERQEAQGQKDFVAQQTLPINGTQGASRALLEALGFKFGQPADDIFVNCTFPPGWTKKPTDHSMWNDLRDAKGRKRGSIFYKAAFYDRSAYLRLERRFSATAYHQAHEGTEVVIDGNDNSVAYVSTPALPASIWLAQKYPAWETVSAYWD